MVLQIFRMPPLSNASSTTTLDLQIQQHCQFHIFIHHHTKTPFSLLLLLNGTTYLLIMSYPSVTQLIHLSITYQNMFLNLCGWYVLYSQLANSML